MVSSANVQLRAFPQKQARKEVDLMGGAVVLRPGISPGPKWPEGGTGIHPGGRCVTKCFNSI